MREVISQGDILKVEGIRRPVLVASKDFFNRSGMIIGCPVFSDETEGPLHIFVKGDETRGYVHCEKLALLDMTRRGYVKTDHLYMSDIMEISDAIQGIFDYI